MDCNNYSYSNMDAKAIPIASSKDDMIYFEHVINYFNEHHYIVADVLGYENAVFEFNPRDPLSERAAYEKAARFYNALVPDDEAIPLF